MPRPKHREFDLVKSIARLQEKGLSSMPQKRSAAADDDALLPLGERIQLILHIIRNKPVKATEMNYFIMYDIENNKVRRLVAKYLIRSGCIRVQKSVFLMHSSPVKLDKVRQTLSEINSVYENEDSIICIPLQTSDARSMKLIGRNVDIAQIIDPPGTVFL